MTYVMYVPADDSRKSELAKSKAREGIRLHSDFVVNGRLDHLDKAIDLLTEAVRDTPIGSGDRATCANNLGIALHDRSERTGDDTDLDEAIRWLRESVAALPRDHPDRARHLSNLATSVETRAARSGVEADVREAAELWREASAVTTAPAHLRLGAARKWATFAADTGTPAAGLDGFDEAVTLLPLAAWWGFDRDTREQLLADSTGLATDAAACAVAAGQPARALELLEGGRAVLWSQLLKTRTDRTALHDVAPELAKRMDHIASELERDEGLDTDRRMKLVREWEEIEDEAKEALERQRVLERVWNELKEQAGEALPGSALDMPSFATLQKAAEEGPVVVINISQWRCDALITKATGEPLVVELLELTRNDAHTQAERYLTALTEDEGHERDQAISETLDWLWRVIAHPVLSALDYREPITDTENANWPHLWWCPTGPLAILPLHAAGHYDPHDPTNDAAVIDRAISSYTPTMLALIRARDTLRARGTTTNEADREDQRLLHVTMSHGPDQDTLPGVIRSRTYIEQLFPPTRRTTLDGSDATRESVETELARHAWVHFDCHGTQDLDNPFRGGLVLHGQTLTVANLAGVRRDHAEFAFLAACKTAVGGIRVPDEAITLTTALQYAGYPYVIGTLWSVHDRSAARVTQSVYGNLAHDGQLWPAGSARALHGAIRAERMRHSRNLSVWASFLHVGP